MTNETTPTPADLRHAAIRLEVHAQAALKASELLMGVAAEIERLEALVKGQKGNRHG